uniref:Arrestin C-terminal-like domain-containing protein n=1 Tax=Strigamia maritima TaxID=126957 RepID=T1IJ54_STRMM
MARKLRKFLILFDNPNLLYFPGQFISGRVLVELDEDTEVRGVFFHVVGEGIVKISDRNRQRHNDKENYIDFSMKLLGETDNRVVALSQGIHSFPFKLGLPLGLPSTFLGKHGWVQYFCKSAVREASGVVHKNQQVFIVMNPIDLNLEPPMLLQPLFCETEQRIGMACVRSGPVSIRMRLDRGGYIPGENINLHAVIKNESNLTIKKTTASLTETIQYMANKLIVQSERRELATLERSKILPGDTDNWVNEILYIPPLPPTNLRGCHLIRIQYDVFFVAETKGSQKEIKLQCPILMATYPFRNSDGTLQRKRGAQYPSSLPVFRPWLNGNTLK